MKMRTLVLLTGLMCCLLFAGCGETTMDGGKDTNGRAGEPIEDRVYNQTSGENGEGAQGAAENITGGVNKGVNNAKNATEDIAGGAGQAVKDAASGVGNAAKDIVDGAGKVVNDAANGVSNAAKNMTGK